LSASGQGRRRVLASARPSRKGVLGKGNGRVVEVGTGGRVGGSESGVGCGERVFGLLVCWRLGMVVVVVVVICTGWNRQPTCLTEITETISSQRSHVSRYCGCEQMRNVPRWRFARTRRPDAESGLGPSPVERSTPSFNCPYVAAILADSTFQVPFRYDLHFLPYPHPPL